MFRPKVFTILLVVILAGCAHGHVAPIDADCWHVLNSDGQSLRFCESGPQITVDTSAPPPPAAARLVDSPEFLANMIDKLPRVEKHDGKGSKLCTGDPPGYLTIRTSDFARMVSVRPVPVETPASGIVALFTPAPPRHM